MTKTIYVPQGYCARMISATKSYGIGGLYTDSFSTCNILACISEDKIILAHVDYPTLMFWNNNLKEEIKSIKNLEKIVIISREHENTLKNELVKFICSFVSKQKVIGKEIDINHDGIYISFNKESSNDIHPNIKIYPIGNREGLELIHHPDEQKFLSVQKIQQIIGVNAKFITKQAKNKNFYIFDGRAWEPMDEAELEVDVSHPLTKEEMNSISKEEPYIVIAGRAAGIVEHLKNRIPYTTSSQELGIQVAFYLEGYLNNYDYVLLFNRNLKDTINSSHNCPRSKEDKIFKDNINQAVNQGGDTFNEVQSLCKLYEDNSPDTDFKKNVMEEITTFSRHYQERKYYDCLKQEYKEIEKQALLLSKNSSILYKQGNFAEAAQTLVKSITLYTYCSSKDHPSLATLYFNCGKAYQQQGQYEPAAFFLETSLILRQQFTKPRPYAEIETTKKALKECQAQISNTRHFG